MDSALANPDVGFPAVEVLSNPPPPPLTASSKTSGGSMAKKRKADSKASMLSDAMDINQ